MSTATGRAAEDLAARFLERAGHRVLGRNWRTRFCELDLITRDRAGVHIVEVKYRARTGQGNACEYVTPAKIRQLERGAQAWAQAEEYDGPIQIDVVSVEGELRQARILHLENVSPD